ncbi:MAG: hypothetical protein R3B96_16230 [Pirellulaceae bacterium]
MLRLVQMRCEVGDQFLLCTDGVVEGLWNRALEELVREPPAKLRFLTDAQRLVQTAGIQRNRGETMHPRWWSASK